MLRDYIRLPRHVHLLCFGALVNRAGSFVLIFLTIYLSAELGFSIGFATTCIGVFGLGAIVAAVLGGHLADRLGRQPVLLVATFGAAATLLAMSRITDRWLLLAVIGLFALLSELYRPAASAMIGDLTPPAQRPHAFSLMYVAINLGFAVAPPLGGWLSEYSWQLLFVCDAATAATFGVLILFTLRETKPASADSSGVSFVNGLSVICRDRTFLLFCCATGLVAMVYQQGMSTLPIYIRSLGFSNTDFGRLIAVNGVLIVLLQLPMTQMLRRYERLRVILTGGLFVALGFAATTVAATFWMFAASIAVWTVGEIMQAAFNQAVVADMAPLAVRARYFGFLGMTCSLSLTVGAPLGGLVLSRFGPTPLWLGCVAIALLSVVLYTRIIHVRHSLEGKHRE